MASTEGIKDTFIDRVEWIIMQKAYGNFNIHYFIFLSYLLSSLLFTPFVSVTLF
nr:MAG TPA: hypothetical protein [Caudoviricetes sp.]